MDSDSVPHAGWRRSGRLNTWRRTIGAQAVSRTWVVIWMAIIGVVAATTLVRGADPTPPATVPVAEPGEVSAVAPDVTVHLVSIEATTAETVISIRTDGRDDLGAWMVHSGAFLTDSSGKQHIERGGSLNGRVLRLRVPGLATLAPGPATLLVRDVGLTNQDLGGPVPDDATWLSDATLAVAVPSSSEVVRIPVNASAALGPGTVAIDLVIRDTQTVIVEGSLQGFTPEQIQSLDLHGSRLLLADGSELALAWGRHGFGTGLRGLELQFDLPNGAAEATQLVLTLGVQVPEVLRSAPADVVHDLAELEQAAGASASLPLTPGATQGE